MKSSPHAPDGNGSLGPTLLRLLRRLAVLLVVLPTLLPLLMLAFSGTGDTEGSIMPQVSFSVVDAVTDLWFRSEVLMLLGTAVLGCAAVHGPRTVLRGLRYAFLEPRLDPRTEARPSLMPDAEALALMSRLLVFGALLFSFASVYSDLAVIRAVLDGGPFPRAGSYGPRGGIAGSSLSTSLAAIFWGRLWLGGVADAALRHSGRPERSAFRSRDDFAVLLFLVPIVLQLFIGFYQFPIR